MANSSHPPSDDLRQNEREKPQVVKETKPGEGWAAVSDASGRQLILSPDASGAESGCPLCLGGGGLCYKESIGGQLHAVSFRCVGNETFVREMGCVCGVERS